MSYTKKLLVKRSYVKKLFCSQFHKCIGHRPVNLNYEQHGSWLSPDEGTPQRSEIGLLLRDDLQNNLPGKEGVI